MPSVDRLFTVDDVRAMPDDGRRYEVIGGELFVTPAPSPRHQTVLGRMYVALFTYVERHRLGRAWVAPLDVVLGPMTLVEPDILFVGAARLSVVTERDVSGAPDLAIEVLSPTTVRTDRGRKRALYQEQGVGEYWVVDPVENVVEIWRPGAPAASVRRDRVLWRPEATIDPLLIDLAALFAP